MENSDDEDDGTNASGVVSDDISKYLRDKDLIEGGDLYGDADEGMKAWLNDKFPKP